MADDGAKSEPVLKEKIDELENLIDERSRRRETAGQAVLPILDELVGESEPGDHGPGQAPFDLDDPRLDDIADQLEQKLSTELDEIVNILKLNLRQSIRDELNILHDHLKSDPAKKAGG
jgi:hypothetical protein